MLKKTIVTVLATAFVVLPTGVALGESSDFRRCVRKAMQIEGLNKIEAVRFCLSGEEPGPRV